MIRLLILTLFLLQGCGAVIKWQAEYPDNYFEEQIEDIIKDKTEKDIDLTPISGEERQSFDENESHQ